MSSFVGYFDWSTRPNKSFTMGMEKGSGTVTAFTFRKSVHSRRVLSDFGTRTIGEPKDCHSPLLCLVPANYQIISARSRSSQGEDDMMYNELAVCQEWTQYGVYQGWFFPRCQKIRPRIQLRGQFWSPCSSGDRDDEASSIIESVVDSSGNSLVQYFFPLINGFFMKLFITKTSEPLSTVKILLSFLCPVYCGPTV